MIWLEVTGYPDSEIVRSPATGIIAAGSIFGIATAGIFGHATFHWIRPRSWGRAAFVSLVLGFLWLLGILYLVNAIDHAEKVRRFFSGPETESIEGSVSIRSASFDEGGHRRAPSWSIQTGPIDLELQVAEADYQRMVDAAPPETVIDDGERIKSNGHLCATVVFQRNGKALRVLNGGKSQLPEGSVRKCPERSDLFLLETRP